MIDFRLKLCSIFFLLIIGFIITLFVKKDKIIIKYAIIWYLSLLLLMIFTIFPEFMTKMALFFGIKLGSNFLFILLIMFLFIMCISLTIIVSNQRQQIKTLIQEVSIMNKED